MNRGILCYLLLSIGLLMFYSCKKEPLCDEDNRVFFEDRENRLKIDGAFFRMASEIDTVSFARTDLFNEFTSGGNGFCALCICDPPKFENYWAEFNNGSRIYLFKQDFQMQLFLFFNENRTTEFQIRLVDGDYIFYEPFTDKILEEYFLEIQSSLVFNGLSLKNVVKIVAKENGVVTEELIYQREKGVLLYKNILENYEYRQI